MSNDDSWQALLARQEELENAGTAAGAERFRKRLAQAEKAGVASSVGAAHLLLRRGLDSLEAVLRDSIDNPRVSDTPCRKRKTADADPGNNKGRGYPSNRQWVQMVGPSTAAYLVLRTAIDRTVAGQPVPTINLAVKITDALTDELRYRRFKNVAPQLFDYKLTTIRESISRSTSHISKTMKASMRFKDIDVSDLDLDDRERTKVGCQLLDLLLEATDWFLIEQEAQHKGKKSPKRVIVLCPEIRSQLAVTNDAMALRQPVLGPMVVPPLPWAPGIRGGYRYALAQRHSLITNVRQRDQTQVAQVAMPQVYAALNAVQETAWRINQPVLALVEEITSLGGGFAGVPRSVDEEIPEKPDNIAADEAARKAWRRAAALVHKANHLRRRDDDKARKVIAVAGSVRDAEAIWFPAHLDFRGRVYPLGSYLSPQGNDLARALLTFAEGKVVDAPARRWLAIHGANCLGVLPDGRKVSQMTLDERHEWIVSNTQAILALAADPIGVPGILLRADKPLQFCAFALDWANLIDAEERGVEYESGLAVNLDGTANGLQHFAAMLRDEAGARAVNVLPQERPSDVYGIVADALLDRLKAEAPHDDRAARWLAAHESCAVVHRKLTKQPCMTFAYGSRRFGFRDQMFEHLSARMDASAIAQHFVADGEQEWKALSIACSYLAGVLQDVLGDTVSGAANGMTWLRKCAKGITARNQPVRWVTPLGLPVVLPYRKQQMIQIRSALGGTVVRCTAHRDTEVACPRKQASGLAPSVVHSLDACHMMQTVNACVEEGVESFMMIHDSYGVCAADVEALNRVLRDEFARLYSGDILGDLHRQFAAQHEQPSRCVNPPSPGNLNVDAVRDSLYFFA